MTLHIPRTALALLAALTAVACGHSHPSKEEMAYYQEAAKHHNEAVEIQGELIAYSDTLAALAEELRAAAEGFESNDGKADYLATAEDLESLPGRLDAWAADLVEVPYNKEHEHHGEHTHAAPANITALEMRDSQKAMLEKIKKLREEMQARERFARRLLEAADLLAPEEGEPSED